MTASPFWTFSLAVYGQAGVPDSCLALQDEHGVDVNVMLCLLWLGTKGRRLEADDVAALERAVSDWKTGIVVPLRRVRRALKSPPEAIEAGAAAALRQQIKAAELEAERLQQEALSAICLSAPPGAPADPDASLLALNMEAYAHRLGTSFPPETISTLVSAAARQM